MKLSIVLFCTCVLSATQAFEIPVHSAVRTRQSHLFVSPTFFLDVVEESTAVAVKPKKQQEQPVAKRQQPPTTLKSEPTPQQQEQQRRRRKVTTTTTTTKTPQETTTLYEILGASPTATRVQLKRRYIALAKQTHPDAVQSATAHDDFSRVAAAWSVLSDPQQRKQYDRTLQAEQITHQVCHWFERLAVSAVAVIELSGKVLNVLKSSTHHLEQRLATSDA